MTKCGKTSVSASVTNDVADKLKGIASSDGVSVASVVRDAIVKYVGEECTKEKIRGVCSVYADHRSGMWRVRVPVLNQQTGRIYYKTKSTHMKVADFDKEDAERVKNKIALKAFRDVYGQEAANRDKLDALMTSFGAIKSAIDSVSTIRWNEQDEREISCATDISDKTCQSQTTNSARLFSTMMDMPSEVRFDKFFRAITQNA